MKFIYYVLVALFGFLGTGLVLVFVEHLVVANQIKVVPLSMGALFLVVGARFLKKAHNPQTDPPRDKRDSAPLETQ